LGGMPRRYYGFGRYEFLEPVRDLNMLVSMAGFVMGAAQLIFIFNFFWSLRKGEKAGENPWQAATLEWTAPSPPPHGNWPAEIPTVHRWPYDYSLPESKEDFTPQTAAAPQTG